MGSAGSILGWSILLQCSHRTRTPNADQVSVKARKSLLREKGYKKLEFNCGARSTQVSQTGRGDLGGAGDKAGDT